ncbi:MAG: trypsin-like serine protease [Actinobacteria bacterium]|nr:trypsin-like serine protease [Actinomycetota bacterium]
MDDNWTPTPPPHGPSGAYRAPSPTTPPPVDGAPAPGRGPRVVLPVLVAALLSAGLAAGGTALVIDREAAPGTTTTVVQEAPPVDEASVSEAVAGDEGDGPVAAIAGDTLDIAQLYEKYGAGVVRVEHSQGLGSGFVIDKDGHILSNAHVVDGAQGTISVSFSNDERVEAQVIGVDNATDVALLKVDLPASALTVVPLGDSTSAVVGEPVVAIGNPFGQDRTVTSGIVSAVARQIEAPNGFGINGVIQTDAAINQGNSGGPLFNMRGQVIGINSQIYTGGTGGGNVGLGYAVPINLVKEVVADLMATGTAQHAWLGVQLSDVDPTLASQVKIGTDQGAMIAGVSEGSPAAAAGLKGATGEITIEGKSYAVGGDVVVEANGQPVASIKDLQAAVTALEPGDELKLVVKRADGSTADITATLGNQPQDPTALAR